MSGPPSFPTVEGNSFYSDAAEDDAEKCPSISEIRTGVESTYNSTDHQDLTNKSPSISEIHGGLKSSSYDNKDSVNGDKYLPPPSRDQMREAVDSQTNSDAPQEEAKPPPPGLSDADPRGERRPRRKFTSSRYKAEEDDEDDDDDDMD